METDHASQPVAKVTGLYRGKFAGIEPLTVDTPLTPEEVRRNPIFYELDLHPEQNAENLTGQGDENLTGQGDENLTGLGGENLIIDVIYDNLSPMRLLDPAAAQQMNSAFTSAGTNPKSQLLSSGIDVFRIIA